MYAANFYVALSDRDDNTVRFVYFVDEQDAAPDPEHKVRLASPEQSPTAWVILNGQNLSMRRDDQQQKGGSWGQGSTAEHWIGSPLLDHQHQCLGAMVIQSYDSAHTFSEEDEALFALIANHVSNALQGMQSVDRLERAVQERTARLEHESAERGRALAALQEAQSELVRQEKLASLGLGWWLACGARNQHPARHLRDRHQPPGAGAQAGARRHGGRRDDRREPRAVLRDHRTVAQDHDHQHPARGQPGAQLQAGGGGPVLGRDPQVQPEDLSGRSAAVAAAQAQGQAGDGDARLRCGDRTGKLPRRGVADRHQPGDELTGARLRARPGRGHHDGGPAGRRERAV
ncbi:GAF domain-containing protein [Massilia sp. B-10]|nr:GAF domain-containing protein [Massilia sp. B-10]